ncbi:efflux transporter outer membrane subunit [Pseudomarimonas salicorniae]|uniref:TolC family protein n=1 Tax=Pseudomarimonas salicorniae TaxID=2933270 RepID=A0ABT0GKC3_9GAMM|nr:TolC family protein [Lysobacter sp. CAU 1642]MCK7594997.1 TolC family protein [Lysobacter sp. CAU 1642]
MPANLLYTARNTGLALIAALSLAACTVGPDYVRPEMPVPETFDQAPAAAQTPESLLWSSLGDEALNRLIHRALETNTSIAQAAARLAETRALSGLTVYSLFPTVTASAGAERNQPSGRDPFIPPDAAQRTDTYRAGFDAAWEIDLFGSLRNQSNAIYQRVDADAAALADVQLSIVAETAQTWFALRGARQQLALRRQQLRNQEGNVNLLRQLFDAGRGNRLDLSRAEAQRGIVGARLPQAEAEVVRHEQRLAVLTALSIEDLRRLTGDSADLPALPVLQTVGSPKDWLQRRPDIRAAERRIAAAYSDIGYETAQYFPILTLLGDFGWTATSFGRLGDSGAQRWSFGPQLSWRFLDFGRVRQQVRAAEARAAGAEAAYRESVLRALEDTENALARLRAANRSAAELEAARLAAADAENLARLRFDNGASGFLEVLDAERTLLDLESQALQARIDQATALAAVYKALAGDFAIAAGKPDANPATAGAATP